MAQHVLRLTHEFEVVREMSGSETPGETVLASGEMTPLSSAAAQILKIARVIDAEEAADVKAKAELRLSVSDVGLSSDGERGGDEYCEEYFWGIGADDAMGAGEFGGGPWSGEDPVAYGGAD